MVCVCCVLFVVCGWLCVGRCLLPDVDWQLFAVCGLFVDG